LSQFFLQLGSAEHAAAQQRLRQELNSVALHHSSFTNVLDKCARVLPAMLPETQSNDSVLIPCFLAHFRICMQMNTFAFFRLRIVASLRVLLYRLVCLPTLWRAV
jgi:hypothetical protein